MATYAKKHKKLYALTEAGYRNTPDAQWYSSTLLPAIKGFAPSYVLLWRNAWDQAEENFGPAPEKSCANDFRKIHKEGAFLFRSQLQCAPTKGCWMVSKKGKK
jgi:mannan endo-1,4-beta-mannosidase